LIDQELSLFEKEYHQYFLEGESKSKEIGRPYLLHNETAKHGVLLVHGLMAAPEEVREWAEFLFAMGYTVYAVRMAGHGTSATDLAVREASEWVASVDRGHEILKSCCEHISIAGFSTGASVALYQAIKKPTAFDTLICISAPLKFKKLSTHFAEPVHAWNQLSQAWDNSALGKVAKTGQFRKEFATNHADNPHINYLRCPVHSIVQIKRLMSEVCENFSNISIPTLVIHGTNDPKVDVQSSREIFARIQSNHKQYKEVDFHLHGIIRGEITRQVFKEVQTFLNQYFSLQTLA
jgi:esterase/lipase